jgi:hypothetical protein
MLSTIKSVKEYTGIDLFQIYNSATKRQEIVDKIVERDPNATPSINDIDADFEARQHIKRAQGIVEIYIGKDEIDIDNPSDLLLLDKMVSYQAAYMVDNEDLVFNQIPTNSIALGGSTQTFKLDISSMYIAPLTAIASKGLSFKKARSFRTGKMFQFPKITKWRNI